MTMADPIQAVDAIDQVLETTAIGHLDFESPCTIRVQSLFRIGPITIPVGGIDESCTKPASVTLCCRRCTGDALVCAGHLEELRSSEFVSCGTCNARGSLADVFDILPVR